MHVFPATPPRVAGTRGGPRNQRHKKEKPSRPTNERVGANLAVFGDDNVLVEDVLREVLGLEEGGAADDAQEARCGLLLRHLRVAQRTDEKQHIVHSSRSFFPSRCSSVLLTVN